MALQVTGGVISNLTAETWSGGAMRDFWFDVPTAPSIARRIVGASSITEIQIEDRVYDRSSGGTAVTDFSWPITIPPSRKATEIITRSSSAPEVVIPDPSDASKWLWVSNGSATLTISCASRTVSAIAVTASTVALAPVDTFKAFSTSSVHKHLIDAVDESITGKTPSQSLPVFNVQNHGTGVYIRNPLCWSNYADLTPISPWNSAGGAAMAGILISPRHVVFALHFTPSVGASIRFINSSNEVVERQITATTALPNFNLGYPDLSIGILDSDVGNGIGFAKVLPSGYASKIPSIRHFPVPALGLDQFERATITSFRGVDEFTVPNSGYFASFEVPTKPSYLDYYRDKVGGDSSNPACLIINGQLVLITCWTFGGPGYGASVDYNRAAINSAMTALGGGYQITDVDLSGFNTY